MRAIVAALFLLASSLARADSLPSPEAALGLTDQVMQRVTAGDWVGGISLMKRYSVVSPQEVDAMIERYRPIRLGIDQRFGANIGYEMIKQDTAGDSLFKVVQLEKREYFGVAWSFLFYKGKDGWVMTTFTVSDRLGSLFAVEGPPLQP
jgi:hypothetical protein